MRSQSDEGGTNARLGMIAGKDKLGGGLGGKACGGFRLEKETEATDGFLLQWDSTSGEVRLVM